MDTGLSLKKGEISDLEYVLFRLKKMALKSNINFKHSATLINKNFLCAGFNKPIIIKHKINKSIHAEVDALCNYPFKKQIKGMDMIVIRVNKNNELRNSRPCNDCIFSLNKRGVRKIIYSNEYGNLVYEFVKDMPKLHACSSSLQKI